MSIADDITGLFNTVSDSSGVISTDVQTTGASIQQAGSSIAAMFGSPNVSTPNAPAGFGSITHNKYLWIGIALVVAALLWKKFR